MSPKDNSCSITEVSKNAKSNKCFSHPYFLSGKGICLCAFCKGGDFTPVVPLKNGLNWSHQKQNARTFVLHLIKQASIVGRDDHISHKNNLYYLSQICVLLTGWAEF